MKNSGRRNVRKHRKIKNGDKYINLDISFKFGSLEKIKITSSYPKDYLGGSWKELITYLVINTIGISKSNKNSSYAITNVSMKYLSKIIIDFEKLSYKGYVWKRPKHEFTDS